MNKIIVIGTWEGILKRDIRRKARELRVSVSPLTANTKPPLESSERRPSGSM